MAYTNETTHFGIPLPLGSDLTTPMDYNESMQAVDTALFESKTDSSSALQKANQLQLDLATTNDNLTGVAGRVTTLEGTSVTQGQAILQNTQDIADVRADALDMIEAKDEGTAQVATVAVTAGNYFRYNDVLYIATENIAIGDTIIPNENCRATNVGTELTGVNNELRVVNNKINIIDHKEVASAEAGQTFAAQLDALKTAYNNLTTPQKLRSMITVGQTSVAVYHLTELFNPKYTNEFLGDTYLGVNMIDLANTKYYTGYVDTLVHRTDASATVNNEVMSLWI